LYFTLQYTLVDVIVNRNHVFIPACPTVSASVPLGRSGAGVPSVGGNRARNRAGDRLDYASDHRGRNADREIDGEPLGMGLEIVTDRPVFLCRNPETDLRKV